VTVGEARSPIPPAGALLREDRYLWAWSGPGGLAYAVVTDRGEVVARGLCPGPSPALNVHVLAGEPGEVQILWLDPASDALSALAVKAAGEAGAARVLATGVDYFTAVGDDLLALARDGEVILLDPSGDQLGRVDLGGGEGRSLDGLVVDDRPLLAVNRRLGSRYELLYLSWRRTSPYDAQVVVLESDHLSLSTVLRPARLGVADGQVYVLLGEESAGGESRGRGAVEYYVFPLSRPDAAERYPLTINPVSSGPRASTSAT